MSHLEMVGCSSQWLLQVTDSDKIPMILVKNPTLGMLDAFLRKWLDRADQLSYDSEEDTIVFPFHEICFDVLVQSLFCHENASKIDKDILYSVLSQLNGGGSSRRLLKLNVDYGGIEGMEQTWDCISGDEVRS
jgi:hypothetical protein